MALALTDDDHDLLDRFLEAVLERHASGTTGLLDARATLAEAFALVARDDGTVRNFMRGTIAKEDD